MRFVEALLHCFPNLKSVLVSTFLRFNTEGPVFISEFKYFPFACVIEFEVSIKALIGGTGYRQVKAAILPLDRTWDLVAHLQACRDGRTGKSHTRRRLYGADAVQ